MEQYIFLRALLATEFALADDIDRQTIVTEFKKELTFLISENCLRLNDNKLFFANNDKLRTLLSNLLMPFIAAIYVTSLVLLQVY